MVRCISIVAGALAVFLVSGVAIQAFAEVSTANVAGAVEDSTGARIPGAAVKLVNSQTGTENDAITNRNGIFLLPGVIPGAYSLQIGRDGFATAQITGLVLNVGDTKSFVIRMQIGAVTQTVMIDASGLVPATADASVSTVIDRRFVANIPLNGRSFQDLISVTPGIVTQSPQTAGGLSVNGDYSVNGQQPDTNSYTVDGVSADIGVGSLTGHEKIASSGSAAGTTALGTTQSIVSIDDLQEFRVLTSNYSAEYGRTTGGQFTLLTSSGMDALHGSLFDYFRNSAADASDWFAGYNEAVDYLPITYRQNDFGGSVGGPVLLSHVSRRGNNTFFFLAYEKLLANEPMAPLVQYVPSPQAIAAAPPSLQPTLKTFPPAFDNNEAEIPPAYTGLSLFVPGSFSEPGSINSTSIRFDHSPSPKVSAFIRTSITPSESESNMLSSATTNHLNAQTDTAGVSFQLSAASTNQFKFGYGMSTSLLSTSLNSALYKLFSSSIPDLNTALGIPPSSFPSAAADVYIHSAGAGASEINTDGAFGSVHEWNLRDTFSLQVGHHLLQAGIDERHVVSTIDPPGLTVEVDFFNPQSVLDNLASDISVTRHLPATPVFNEFAFFVQDEWQASKRLTLSTGLRWDIDPAPRGKNGADAYTLLGNVASPATLTLAPRGTSLWEKRWSNLAPRFGAAWIADRRTDSEFVVRAGGGVFFDTDNRAAAPAFSALGFSATKHPENVPVPVTTAELNFSVLPSAPYTGSSVFAFPRNLQLPYALQWNISVEKAFGKSQTITASYVGLSGRRLLEEQRTNVSAQNPELSEVNWFPSCLTSNYQALQLKFQRSVTPGIQALASYTWSHALDYGSTDPAWTLTRADSDFDVRQNLEAVLSWEERNSSGKGLRASLLRSWGADARLTTRTAFPITPLGNLFSDPASGNRYFSGVDSVPNRPLYLYGSQYPGGRAINGGPYATNPAFNLPGASAPGNAPRNMLRGFGDNQLNLAARRILHLNDRFNAQLRLEIYNLFNHPDLGYVDPSLRVRSPEDDRQDPVR